MSFLRIIFFCLSLGYIGGLAQHVTEDTVYYTPIPLPGEVIKNKSDMLSSKPDTIPFWSSPYFLSVQSGFMVGCIKCQSDKTVSSSFSVLNGLKLGAKMRVGLGVGFDSYLGWQVLPVFGSFSWDVFGNRTTNAIFIQMNYGLSKAWYQQSLMGYSSGNPEGGRMVAPQIGYRLKYHDMNITFLAGYKMQRTFAYYAYPIWTWAKGEYQQVNNTTTVRQDFSRLMFTMAVGWK